MVVVLYLGHYFCWCQDPPGGDFISSGEQLIPAPGLNIRGKEEERERADLHKPRAPLNSNEIRGMCQEVQREEPIQWPGMQYSTAL